MAEPRPTGQFTPRDDGVLLEFERTFDVPIDEVWAAVTESDRLARYIGTWTGDPDSGVIEFQMTSEGEVGPELYHLLVCEPPTRLLVQLGDTPQDEQPVGQDDARTDPWLLELVLSEVRGVTTLALRQQIDDPAKAPDIACGWEYYLDRLVAAERGEDAESILFEPYAELAGAYRSAL